MVVESAPRMPGIPTSPKKSLKSPMRPVEGRWLDQVVKERIWRTIAKRRRCHNTAMKILGTTTSMTTRCWRPSNPQQHPDQHSYHLPHFVPALHHLALNAHNHAHQTEPIAPDHQTQMLLLKKLGRISWLVIPKYSERSHHYRPDSTSDRVEQN